MTNWQTSDELELAFLPDGVLFGLRQWDLKCGCAPDAPAELTRKGLPVQGAVL